MRISSRNISFILIVSFTVLVNYGINKANAQSFCMDSDGGDVPDVNGTCRVSGKSFQDNCSSITTLKEQYCRKLPFSLKTECAEKTVNCNSFCQSKFGSQVIGVCSHNACLCQPIGEVVEKCDGLDNDFDGLIDEDFDVGQPCMFVAGICQSNSIKVCNQYMNGTVCNATSVRSNIELCNGMDDDMDGAVDEGSIGSGASCHTGQKGICAEGAASCSGGHIVCNRISDPTHEVCNGIDDDCDGVADDDIPAWNQTCNTGQLGACSSGTMLCIGGSVVCYMNVNPTAESCNGVDDDCDGQVDENPETCQANITTGVRLDTTNTKLYLGDALTKSGTRTTVTSNDLSTLLKSGTFNDDGGVAYNYDQYITFKTGTITFGKSGGDFEDPQLYMDIGTSTSTPLYETSVVFNRILNISSSDAIGNNITMFGNNYTIGAGSDFTSSKKKLILISASFERLVLENGASVKKGTMEDPVDGTLVTLTGTTGSGLSKLTIATTATDSNNDFIIAGSAFIDPVWTSFKVAFGGIYGGTSDIITIDNSGIAAATVNFTDYRGNQKKFTWAYTGSSSFAPALNETSSRKYHVLEGEWILKNDYALITPSQESEFGHILQYSRSSSIGSSGAFVEFKDLMSGQTNRVYLEAPGYDNATFYVDGQQYFVDWEGTGSERVRLSWGTSAGPNGTAPYLHSTGTKTTLFPLIKTKRGGFVTLAEPVTLTNAVTYELPTNTSFTYTALTMNATAQTFGRVSYNITSADVLRLADASSAKVALTNPTVMVFEEKHKDATETEVKDAVFATVADGSGTGVDTTVTFSADYLTAGTKVTSDNTLTSDNSVTVYGDRRGTFVKYDTDSQGLIEITYPDDQAIAWVAVGADPKFSTATEGGATVNAAIKIDTPVAKLDSEVNTAALTSDLILVGGPCANKLVAKLAEDAASGIPACDAWNLQTGLIKQVTNAFGSGKKALVVAGTQGTDTRNLAAQVMKGTLSFQA